MSRVRKTEGNPFRRKFATPEDLYNKCLEYFNDKTINDGIITPCGLRLHLDIAAATWHDYTQREEYRDICEWAKATSEHWLEKKLLLENKPVGAIFQLKSVYGRSDQPLTKNETNNYVYVFGNEARQLKKVEHLDAQLIEGGNKEKLIEHKLDDGLNSIGQLEIAETIAKKRRPRGAEKVLPTGVKKGHHPSSYKKNNVTVTNTV